MTENNFDSGLWEYQEPPPCVLNCDHCNNTTEYVCVRAWKNLTEEEVSDIAYDFVIYDTGCNEPWFDRQGFARAIEAKLKEKNSG